MKVRNFSLNKFSFIIGFLLIAGAGYLFYKKETFLIEKANDNVKLTRLEHQYKQLNEKLKNAEEVLKNVQDRDSYLYRTYFEMNPISDGFRKGGFGGVDRYKDLKNLPDAQLVIQTSKKIDMLSKSLVIQSESLEEIAKRAKKKEKMLASIPAIQPIANGQLKRISSGYGMRIHPILKVGKMHWGIDFSAKTGTPIYATGDGIIKTRARKGGFGKVVVIDHGYGYETYYGHMSKFGKYRLGQPVKRGNIIGYVGSTGLSTGSHLHYEVHKNGKRINPISFFYRSVSPDDYKKLYDQAERMSLSMD